MSRDVLGDLLDASYMGVPFYVSGDNWKGGRRLAIHEFYGRDDPFIEDLGASADHLDLEIYLVGDTYDADAAAVQAAFGTEGPALLVLPVDGPVMARLDTFDRDRKLDRSGFIGFHAHFVRDDGMGGALLSSPFLATLAFDAVSALVAGSGDVLGDLAVLGAPSWVVASAVGGLGDIVATLDTLRAGTTLTAAAAAPLASQLASAYQALPAQVDPIAGVAAATAPTLAGLAVALADAMPPATAVTLFAGAFDAVVDPPSPDPTRSANALTAIANDQVVADAARLVYLTGYVEALIGTTYSSRPEAITARADCVERFAVALEAASEAARTDLFVALEALRARVVDYLSTAIINAAPIVTVTGQASMPSLWWAWRLYQDPTRAGDLIARNDVKHPSFMPTDFEALAPSASTLLPTAA